MVRRPVRIAPIVLDGSLMMSNEMTLQKLFFAFKGQMCLIIRFLCAYG